MRLHILIWLAFALGGSTVPGRAGFIGELKLTPPGCESKGTCVLGSEFGYVDPTGTGWMAAAGLLTDGASIPPWAVPIVGKPFEAAFVKAAVIHDHYCARHVRPWRQTHRVFYDALRESGVSKGKAGTMYFAILVGGPKWAKLVKGKPCPLGHACINDVRIGNSVPGTNVLLGEENAVLLTRPAAYASARFANLMALEVPELERKGEALEVEDVELKAAKAMAGDFFFSNGDEIGGELGAAMHGK